LVDHAPSIKAYWAAVGLGLTSVLGPKLT
jgi:hypothetical protein